MATFSEATDLADTVLDSTARWYKEIPAPLRVAEGRVLRKAAALCSETWTRCTIEPDGSIIVWNRPVW